MLKAISSNSARCAGCHGNRSTKRFGKTTKGEPISPPATASAGITATNYRNPRGPRHGERAGLDFVRSLFNSKAKVTKIRPADQELRAKAAHGGSSLPEKALARHNVGPCPRIERRASSPRPSPPEEEREQARVAECAAARRRVRARLVFKSGSKLAWGSAPLLEDGWSARRLKQRLREGHEGVNHQEPP